MIRRGGARRESWRLSLDGMEMFVARDILNLIVCDELGGKGSSIFTAFRKE